MLSAAEFKRTAEPDVPSRFSFLRERQFPQFPANIIDDGGLLTYEWIRENSGQTRPIVVRDKESIKLIVPDATKLSDIMRELVVNPKVRLIDVEAQSEIHGYSVAAFAEYLDKRTVNHKILNMISLEISNTPLVSKIRSPYFVRSVDWIDLVWPVSRRWKGDYPCVQLYCLVGMKDSFTDFHVDFGGTSVWYHVVAGQKRFFLVPPTAQNLCKYETWTCQPLNERPFFGDLVSECFYVDLMAGQTLFLPGGYIHAVYTYKDSLVYGGNYLHSHSVWRQLQAYSIEERTHVQSNFRFPFFRQISFYALCMHLAKLRSKTENYDAQKLASLQLQDVFDSEAMYRQFPYLVKACELWLVDTVSKNNELNEKDVTAYRGAAAAVGLDNPSHVTCFWWDILASLAAKEQLDAQKTQQPVFDFCAHIENLKCSPDMPNFLDEEEEGRALLPSETCIDWKHIYREAMRNGSVLDAQHSLTSL